MLKFAEKNVRIYCKIVLRDEFLPKATFDVNSECAYEQAQVTPDIVMNAIKFL